MKLDRTTAVFYHTMPSTNLQGHFSKSKMSINAWHGAAYHLSLNKNKFHFLVVQHNFLCTPHLDKNSIIRQDIQSLLFAPKIRSFL